MTKRTVLPPPSKLGVVLLAAGASSRMRRPKLLLTWGRTSVVGHLLRQWRGLRARQIAVVCRGGDRRLAAELDRLRFPALGRIENPRPERGMFSSIVCAAHWDGWEEAVDAWVIVLGDQPHLSGTTLGALLAFQRRHQQAVCQPAYGGHGRHPVILPRRAFLELKNCRATTLKDFLRETSAAVLQCPIDDPALALDLDWPADYERLSPAGKSSWKH
jgi:molybdenum cofactor cytidylyltransferase